MGKYSQKETFLYHLLGLTRKNFSATFPNQPTYIHKSPDDAARIMFPTTLCRDWELNSWQQSYTSSRDLQDALPTELHGRVLTYRKKDHDITTKSSKTGKSHTNTTTRAQQFFTIPRTCTAVFCPIDGVASIS